MEWSSLYLIRKQLKAIRSSSCIFLANFVAAMNRWQVKDVLFWREKASGECLHLVASFRFAER